MTNVEHTITLFLELMEMKKPKDALPLIEEVIEISVIIILVSLIIEFVYLN